VLFQGEVWGNPVVCRVDRHGQLLPPGEYRVNLYFAEIYWGPSCPRGYGGVGSRVFDIRLEGQTALTDVDVYAEAGCAASTTDSNAYPVVKRFVVPIHDGVLDIELPAALNNPKISAIEILTFEPQCTTDTDCDDGNVCNGQERCVDLACVSGQNLSCPPSSDCGISLCDPAVGCRELLVSDGTACDDGNPATVGDACLGGVCQADPAVEVRINVNGPQHEGIEFPGTWVADPGRGGVCGPDVYTNASPIHGTQDDALFQGEVWGNPVVCRVDHHGQLLPAGEYLVNLYFAEIYWGPGCPGGGNGVGSRVFDIRLEGQTALAGGDIYAEAGCAASTTDMNAFPVVKRFVVPIHDGALDIELPAALNNPKISAIEILAFDPECRTDEDCDDGNVCNGPERCVDFACVPGQSLTCPPPSDCGISTCDPALGCRELLEPDGTSCDDGNPATLVDGCYGGICQEAPAVEVRINVNGPQHEGIDFPGTWAADPGRGGICSPEAYTNASPIHGTDDDALFQGEVWGNPVVCRIDHDGQLLPAGEYLVNLYFAEIYWGPGCPGGGNGVGSRVFDIRLEGQTALAGGDIYAEAGCAASTTDSNAYPVIKSFVVPIQDGALDIELPAAFNNPKISAIEILTFDPECATDTDCDDGNVCTQDACDGLGACTHSPVPDETPCDDGDPKTVRDVCAEGACLGVAKECRSDADCDDLDVCTQDGGPIIYVSSSSGGTVDGVSFRDEDILKYDAEAGTWAMFFDGSSLGLGGADVFAFHVSDRGSIFISFNDQETVPGLGVVDGSDIVEFIPTSLGPNTTSGTFELFLDGSERGLSGENIDAIGFAAHGPLVISTMGSFDVGGLSGKDVDLIALDEASGTWSMYFDGSDVGLTDSDEDVRGTWIDPATNEIYLTTREQFSVSGVSGGHEDIFVCLPGSLGSATSCTFSLFWSGLVHGLGEERVVGISLDLPPAGLCSDGITPGR
jgi:hypothetical protein